MMNPRARSAFGWRARIGPEFLAVVWVLPVGQLVSNDVLYHPLGPTLDPVTDADVSFGGSPCRTTAQPLAHVADPTDRVPFDLAIKVPAVDLPGHGLQVSISTGTHPGALTLDLVDDLGYHPVDFSLRSTPGDANAHAVAAPLPVHPRPQATIANHFHVNGILLALSHSPFGHGTPPLAS